MVNVPILVIQLLAAFDMVHHCYLTEALCFLQAQAIMSENHSAITRLMYQLFIALGKKSVSVISCATSINRIVTKCLLPVKFSR